jgi:large subunit ribosomal protein L3
MAKGLLGRKVGMTQVFDEAGLAFPVTVLEVGPCHVLQVRTPDRDGYEAVQLGFGDKPRRLASRSERGHVALLESKRSKQRKAAGVELPAKADCEPQRFIREIRGPAEGMTIGQKLTVGHLNGVKAVDVTAMTKGCGFQGVMKRWNFGGLRASHGTKKVHRSLGGTGGMGTNRGGGRPKKGKKMPGQYGFERVTTRNIKVVRVDEENGLLLLHGAVPGPPGGMVIIKETNKY